MEPDLDFKALQAAVRAASRPGPWAQGVKLARVEGTVHGRQESPDGVAGAVGVRVRGSGSGVPARVTLHPAREEWSCDCDAPVDPCAHVVAAVIALAQAAEQGLELPAAEPAARLRYRLGRKDGALSLERIIVRPDGGEEVLRGSIYTPVGKPVGGLEPSEDDRTLDRMLATRQPGYFPSERLTEVFAALAGAADVRLLDRPVRVSAETVGPQARLAEEGENLVLLIERDSRIDEVVAPEVVLLGQTLHPAGRIDLTGARLDRLPLRRVFTPAQLGQLVTEVLPDLERQMEVKVQTARLPRARTDLEPRVHIELHQKPAHVISVLASIVYGDPPVARLENDQLVPLQGTAPRRREPAERALALRLRDELHLTAGRVTDFDGADAVRFATRLQSWDDGSPGAQASRAARGLAAHGQLVPRFRVVEDEAGEVRFDLSFELQGDGATGGGEPAAQAAARVDGAAVVRAYQDGLPLVPIPGGGWAPLPADWLARFGGTVADLLAARRDDGTVGKSVLPALVELCDALEHPRPPSFEELAPLLAGSAGIPAPRLPDDLTATLRPYQERGVAWLCFLREAGLGAVLADDMGLGKTLQTLCAVRGRTLVVCPRSVVHNWAAEARRFRPGLPVFTYHGAGRQLRAEPGLTLTTYALLRLDADRLAAERWDTLILDEAQAIKNPDSQVARAAYALQARFRVALSGTPVENRLEELWSVFHFTHRGLLGGRSDFDATLGRPVAEGDQAALARLRRKIGPFLLRRRKLEVAPELPPRVDSVLHVELDEQERDVYDAVRAATRKEVVERLAAGGSVLLALEALLRLRQAACHRALLPEQQAPGSSKVEALLEALTDAAANGHKALVFSQWTSLLDLVEPHLREAGIAFLRLDGSTRDRAAVVNGFQDAGGPPVLLISLKAGGTGLNLTAADHVFLLDPWWNPAVEDQAADRAHRIGQDRPVLVYRLVAKDTVEERILALQERKRGLAAAALDGGTGAVSLTRDDLLELLA